MKVLVPVGVRRFPTEGLNCNAPKESVEPTLKTPLRVNEPVPEIAEVPTSNVAFVPMLKFTLAIEPAFAKV